MYDFFVKNNVHPLGLFWLIFCGFYLTKVTPVSPVYFAFVICFLVSLPLTIISREKFISYSPVLFYLLLSIVYSYVFFTSPIQNSLNFYISIMSPIIVFFFFKNSRVNVYSLLCIFFIYAILFNLDGVWRILNPKLDGLNVDKLESMGVGFQIYKMNSFMYIDSNFVGVQNLFMLSAFVYIFKDLQLNVKLKFFYAIVLISLFVSLVITFSRAAYLGCAVLLLMYIMDWFKRFRFIVFLIMPLIVFITYFFFEGNFSDDVSYNSKFEILNLSFDYLIHADLFDLLLGVGIGNAVDYIGIGAHNIIVTYLIETGLFGFSLFVAINVMFFRWLRWGYFFICIPFLLASLSLGSTAIPYFFTFVTFCKLMKDGSIELYS